MYLICLAHLVFAILFLFFVFARSPIQQPTIFVLYVFVFVCDCLPCGKKKRFKDFLQNLKLLTWPTI